MKRKVQLIVAAVFASFFLTGCTDWGLDRYGRDYNFTNALQESGTNVADFKKGIESAIKSSSDMSERADLMLMLGRLGNDQAMLSFAMDFYHKAAESSRDNEEKALLFESIAALESSRYNYLRAAEAWRRAGENERAWLNFNLAIGRKIVWQFDTSQLQNDANNAKPGNAFREVIIGSTKAELGSDDVIVSQADLVARDFQALRMQSPFSGILLPESIKQLNAAGFRNYIAAGVVLKEIDGRWYAPNENGIYMFEVPRAIVLQPTTRFLARDIAAVIDTHGIGMIAAQAVEKNATAVFGSCDSSGDAKAAKYLGEKGIKVACITDTGIPLLISAGADAASSAALSIEGGKAVIGNRPIAIRRNEPAVAGDYAGKEKQLLSYGTPAKYFSELEKQGIKLNVFLVEIGGMNQTGKIIKKAKEKKAAIIAAGVLNEDDYSIVKAWLEENSSRKAILFGSEASPYAYKLAREFKSQTSFGGPKPVVL